MAKRKKPRGKHESGPTVTDEEAAATAITDWLQTVDKPLAKEKQDAENPEPEGE